MAKTKRRARRFFTEEYKDKIAKAVVDDGMPPSMIAKSSDIGVHSVRAWVKAYKKSNKKLKAPNGRAKPVLDSESQIPESNEGISAADLIERAEAVTGYQTNDAIRAVLDLADQYGIGTVRQALNVVAAVDVRFGYMGKKIFSLTEVSKVS